MVKSLGGDRSIGRPALLGLLLTSAFVAAGCSVSSGEKTMPKAEVEKQSAIELGKSVGVPASKVPPINCPGDLKAKVGATMTCVLGDPAGKTYDTLITVTRVDDKTNQVYFDIKVSKTPRG